MSRPRPQNSLFKLTAAATVFVLSITLTCSGLRRKSKPRSRSSRTSRWTRLATPRST